MYQRLVDEGGEFETGRRRPIPSAPAIDVNDPSNYQATFLRLVRDNQPKKVIELINRVPGADWNFVYDHNGLSPLSCLVSPDYSNLDQDSIVSIVEKLVNAGASVSFGNGASRPACQNDAAFIAAAFGQEVVVRHLLDLGYPIDQESSPTDNSSDYFATLLHAAASCNSLPTMQLLLRRGIRCSATDQLGRTALHLVLDVAPELDTCLFLQHRAGLDPFQPDLAGNTPFSMSITVLPDYTASILEGRSRKHKQLRDGAIWKYDFRHIIVDDAGRAADFVDYVPDEGGAQLGDTLSELTTPLYQYHPQPIRYAAVQLMIKHGQKQLLVLPIMKMVLKEAWDQFARSLWRRQLGEYVLFLALFITLSHLWPTVHQLRSEAHLPTYLFPLAAIVALMALRQTYKQSHKIWMAGWKLWAASAWNFVDLGIDLVVLSIVCCQVVVLLGRRSFWGPNWVNLSAVMHIVLGLKLLRFACVPKETGAMVAMMASLLKAILRFLIFFLMFFLPFASAYYLLFREGYKIGFRTVMITLARWLFGDIEFEIFSDHLPNSNVQTGQVLHIFYMVTVGIALLNILIALISNTFNAVIENAEGEWILVFAKEIVEIMEASCTQRQIDRYHRALLDKSGHPLFYEVTGAVEANWVNILRERLLHLNKQQRTMARKMNDIRETLHRIKYETDNNEPKHVPSDL